VFRNGAVGSQIFPKAQFRVGGALYGANSSAFIRNCRFEANTSDFGGAVYVFRSTIAVDGCNFTNNLGRNEGGGLMLYESSGTVSNTTFTANAAAPFGTGAASAFKAVGARTAGGVVRLESCDITGGVGGVGASAVEFFDNAGVGIVGSLVVTDTRIAGNTAGGNSGGLRMIGAQSACVLSGGTEICGNSGRNVSGPFLIDGSATVCDCLADVTLDNAVNGGDLGVVLAAWGAASTDGAGDVNHDGLVNANDLAQVLASWGACP
jgi:hypothetical protein